VKKHIPNLLTCCNLLCGCLGIVAIFQGHAHLTPYLIWLAALFDFLDGFVARITKSFSAIGKELDSLADMVTFGVLPGAIMYHLIQQISESTVLPFTGFLITIFSALRLAKFNIDTRQSENFIGLPTPANTLFISSLILIQEHNYLGLETIITNLGFLMGVTVLFSYLLIAEIKLFALKFKNFTWQKNKVKYIFLAISLLLIFTLKFVSLPVIIILYIALSIIDKFITNEA
jgi:CDP-diacylglycerol---serine O-phosphatidyltransferase